VYLEALQNTNSAFVSIYTKRPKGDVLVPKISAIQRIPDWDWVIGSGDFVDDIDKTFMHYLVQFLIIGGIVLAGVVVLALVLARGILRQLGGEPHDAAESMRRIANGDLAVEIELKDGDETSLMASLKLMQMKLKNITAAIQENTSSLDEQIQTFTAAAKTYAQSKLEEDLNIMLRSIQKLWKLADILGKSVSRFKS
jgi:methyl-accepting chemotaxis protein